MKKVFSWILFALTECVFAFDIFFTIDCSIEVKRNYDRLAATPGASGVDYLGTGEDFLFIGIFVISAVGLIVSCVSAKIAHHRAVRSISYVQSCLFVLGILACFWPLYL